MTCWIQTYTGRKFTPLDPRPEDVAIEDIAHALSLICRFTGHVREFYSVAQHSVLAAEKILQHEICFHARRNYQKQVQAIALLHDAHEAYLADLAAPLKQEPTIQGTFEPLEMAIQTAIHEAFFGDALAPDLLYSFSAVHTVDRRMLATEKRDLMNPSSYVWHDMLEPYRDRIIPWDPPVAEAKFLERAEALGLMEKRG